MMSCRKLYMVTYHELILWGSGISILIVFCHPQIYGIPDFLTKIIYVKIIVFSV
jgi:hypothetical protein